MLKKILIGIATLVVLLIVGALIVVSLVDVDRYKPQIAQMAQDKLDRKLTFDGKLRLSLFPSLAVDLPHTTLSEHGSDAPFLSLDRARVSVAIWPLLSGRIEAGTASLYGLRATVVHHADGTTNVDDLSGGAKSAPKVQQAPQPGAASGSLPAFEVGGIDLVDAQVVYRDERAHNTVTLSRLNLKTGRIAEQASIPIEFSASVAATQPATAVDLSLKTNADLNLAVHSLVARAFEARARGSAGAAPFDVAIAAPQINVDTGHQRLSIEKMTVEIKLESAALPQKALKIALDGTVTVDAESQSIATHLTARFDDTTASTRVEVHGFSPPRIAFDVDVDRLNLDRYLPASAPGGAAAGGPGAAAKAVPAAADPKVDLSPLKSLNLSGEARIGSLQVHNAKAAKLRVGVRASGGQLEVSPLTASLYEGSLNATSKVDANDNRVAVNATLEGISIEPLLKDLMGKDILEGHGGVKISVTTSGPTAGAMRRALGGTASLALRDGAVHGINIARTLRNLNTALAGGSAQTQAADSGEKTDFSELTGSFSIKNGVATNNDLQAKSPLLRLNGAGTIDIGAGSLDYTAQATVVGTLAGQGGAELSSLNGVTVPVHLTGPFNALSYRLDWSSVARQAIKSKAADRLKSLLGGKPTQGGSQSPAPNPVDALKGLFGK